MSRLLTFSGIKIPVQKLLVHNQKNKQMKVALSRRYLQCSIFAWIPTRLMLGYYLTLAGVINIFTGMSLDMTSSLLSTFH